VMLLEPAPELQSRAEEDRLQYGHIGRLARAFWFTLVRPD